jgi:hypothetical protein
MFQSWLAPEFGKMRKLNVSAGNPIKLVARTIVLRFDKGDAHQFAWIRTAIAVSCELLEIDRKEQPWTGACKNDRNIYGPRTPAAIVQV